MKTNRVFSIVLVFALGLASIPLQAQAQQPVIQSNTANGSAQSGDETQLSNLVAQARPQRRAGFALMTGSYAANTSGPVFSIIPAAAGPNLTVLGSGTVGRLTKWTGFTSSNSFIGDSTIFESKSGLVGIGTDSPTSKLTVAGMIQSTSGGLKFPDGTVQTTAGIAPNQVVRSLNGLAGDLALEAGKNIKITSSGNALTIAATGAEEPGRMPYQETRVFSFSEICSSGICFIAFSAVPAGKRLVIQNISALFRLSPNVFIEEMSFGHGTSSTLGVFVPTTLQGKTGGGTPVDFYMANQSVLAFADPGNTPTVHVVTSAAPGSFFHAITLTGYYVDVP